MAKLQWHNQQPYSAEYDDVYFSSDNGLAESEYVFIQGNQLHTRWQSNPAQSGFTIIETGFGTGLNFCCAAQAWLNAENHGKLHFVSIDKHPLPAHAIQQALSTWPTLVNISEALNTEYKTLAPDQIINSVTLPIFPNIDLTLYFGDVVAQLARITTKADAWFLDGFAPAKNPAMWQPAVFTAMANLSKPGSTVATFTSAGAVRRGLLNAGFDMQKRSGFGKKREMLIGQWRGIHA